MKVAQSPINHQSGHTGREAQEYKETKRWMNDLEIVKRISERGRQLKFGEEREILLQTIKLAILF